jgi:hypothetical protein
MEIHVYLAERYKAQIERAVKEALPLTAQVHWIGRSRIGVGSLGPDFAALADVTRWQRADTALAYGGFTLPTCYVVVLGCIDEAAEQVRYVAQALRDAIVASDDKECSNLSWLAVQNGWQAKDMEVKFA